MNTALRNILLSAIFILALAGCDSTKKEKAIIDQYLPEINSGYLAMCSGTDLLQSATLSLNETSLEARITLADTSIHAASLSQPLVQYALSTYLKANPGPRLDNILNALGRMEGSLALTITDCDGDSAAFDVSASRLKQLVRQRPMDLDFNTVRSEVLAMMGANCDAYMKAAAASGCTFRLQGGFAEYTLIFPSRSDYRQFTQANLAGRYVNLLKPQYEAYGTLRPLVQSLLESLQIEGYRFIYTDGVEAHAVRSAIPWRLLD